MSRGFYLKGIGHMLYRNMIYAESQALKKKGQKLIEYVNAQLMSQKLSSMIDATETQSFEVEFPFE